MTRTGWLLVGGLFMGLWLLMPILLVTAGTKSDPKPASSAAELSTIRGVVKATAQATLASQVQGRISQLPFREGQRLKGALLVAPTVSKMSGTAASRRNIAVRRSLREKLRSPSTIPSGHSNRSPRPKPKSACRREGAQVTVKAARACTVSRRSSNDRERHENVFPNDQLISLLDIACWRSSSFCHRNPSRG